MREYWVEGRDKAFGFSTRIRVEAKSEQDARRAARRRGVVASRVEPVEEAGESRAADGDSRESVRGEVLPVVYRRSPPPLAMLLAAQASAGSGRRRRLWGPASISMMCAAVMLWTLAILAGVVTVQHLIAFSAAQSQVGGYINIRQLESIGLGALYDDSILVSYNRIAAMGGFFLTITFVGLLFALVLTAVALALRDRVSE